MALRLASSSSSDLLYVSFNQDASCFSVGTSTGLRIYNVNPFRENSKRDFASGVGCVEMLYRCNILALVGGGSHPRYPEKKVMIWDDHVQRCVGELSFKSKVLGVKLRRDRVVVVMESKVYSYRFRDLKLIDKTETVANPSGLHALSSSSKTCVLAMPGMQRGVVRVVRYVPADDETDNDDDQAVPTRPSTTLINAHESDLVAMALNEEGELLATASEKGTLIRVFETRTGRMTHELRRGAERAVVHSLAFDPASDYLACTSDKGTVHVFDLHADDENAASAPTTSSEWALPSSFRSVLPKYFSSTWSVAQFRIPEAFSIVRFGREKHTVVVVGAEGSFYLASFDPSGANKTMRRLHYASFAVN